MQQHCVLYKKLCMRAFCLKFATAKEAWDILSMNFGVRGSSCFNSSYILWLCYAIFRSIEGKRNQPIAEKKNEDDEDCNFIAEFDNVLVQDECIQDDAQVEENDSITGFDAELKLTEDWLEKPNYVEVDCTITAGARSLA